VIACTQEAPLFSELADQAGSASELKFVQYPRARGLVERGRAGHAEDSGLARAGRSARARSRDGRVYKSGGELLIVGPAERRFPGRRSSPGNST